MSLDSLGKKTHLPNVIRLFDHIDDIWSTKEPIDLREAAKLLEESKVTSGLRKQGIPSDVRALQAYVKRFFQFLQLPFEKRKDYPTLILSVADSVALRQCLFIDWAFNTSETDDAFRCLNEELKTHPIVEISTSTEKQFCKWIGIRSDNTRRGPFARWLEDVGLAAPCPDRGVNQTSILVSASSASTVCSEAFVYGLMVEYCGLSLKPTEKPLDRALVSKTARYFLLPKGEAMKLLSVAQKKGYISLTRSTVRIDPSTFCNKLRMAAPWPSADWIDDSISVNTTISPELARDAINFPPDDCTAMGGDPFEKTPEIIATQSTGRSRDSVFRKRVGAAYRFSCAVTGKKLRSPYASKFYGDAAHIIPHSGEDRNGNAVYGKNAVSNGIYLDSFLHWCFDSGWITLEPIIQKTKLRSYKIKVASIAAEDSFKREFNHFSRIDNAVLDPSRLPVNPEYWPNVVSLDWHRENVFADSRL